MSAPRQVEIPIFELPLVMLPTERIPLHIFEERYKRMIGHSLETSEPFGIVFRDDDGARAVGCTATVDQMLERLDDGRMNIVALGVERFRVVADLGTHEGPRAMAEMCAEDPEPGDPGDAHAAFEALLEAVEGEHPDDGLPTDAFGIAAMIELPAPFKQELLETDGEAGRLAILHTELRRLTDQVKRTRELAELARTNGHGPVEGLR